jgi:hypothetical protein
LVANFGQPKPSQKRREPPDESQFQLIYVQLLVVELHVSSSSSSSSFEEPVMGGSPVQFRWKQPGSSLDLLKFFSEIQESAGKVEFVAQFFLLGCQTLEEFAFFPGMFGLSGQVIDFPRVLRWVIEPRHTRFGVENQFPMKNGLPSDLA